MLEARGAAKHPTMLRMDCKTKNFPTPNVSNAEVEKSWPKVITVHEYKSEKKFYLEKVCEHIFKISI